MHCVLTHRLAPSRRSRASSPFLMRLCRTGAADQGLHRAQQIRCQMGFEPHARLVSAIEIQNLIDQDVEI